MVSKGLLLAAAAVLARSAALCDPLPEPAGLVTTESGLRYVVTSHGNGPLPKPGQVVIYNYRGTLPDGTVFDSSFERPQPFAFTFGKKQVIKGVEEAFLHFGVGDKGTMILPPELAYGDKQRGPIPPHSTLRFDIEVIGLKDHALADMLAEAIDGAGLEAAQATFAKWKAEKPADVYVSEAQINALGYRYLQKEKDKVPEAVAVLRWNAELFPASGNVYDSLAEALLKQGDKAGARENYRKSLELDPSNANAKKMLEGL